MEELTLVLLLVVVFVLLYWFLSPAVTLTKSTPVHPSSLHYFDPQTPNDLKPFPSLLRDEPGVYISLIAPAYNEESRLPVMLEKTLRYLQVRALEDQLFTYEVIVVDDGSRDGTR
jgi:dolichyl-phosphate beta-glucosyltransferase